MFTQSISLSALLSVLCSSLWLLTACSKPTPPDRPFLVSQLPAAPDYADTAHWAALPFRHDMADSVPPGASPDRQASAQVDVFFIHPTTLMRDTSWNGDLSDSALNERTDRLTLLNQATVFNHVAKIYAPRYRQMTLGGFFQDPGDPHWEDMVQSLGMAYQDVETAFDYYLEHWNGGRPFFIASHSQGTVHAIRLLRERIDGTALQQQLIAAYVPGWPFPADTFAHLPVCQTPEQTGCVMGWAAWKMGHVDPDFDSFYKGAVVVNPISWRTDGLLAPADLHQGFIGQHFGEGPSQRRLSAQAYRGVLWVSKPWAIVPNPNFHIGDYNLFWGNIRENVALRAAQYVQAQEFHSNRP